MSEINYLEYVTVRLGKTIVGTIVHEPEGWIYFTKGSKHKGEPFATLEECKQSLEEE